MTYADRVVGWTCLVIVVAWAAADLIYTEIKWRRWRRAFRASMERARRSTWEKP